MFSVDAADDSTQRLDFIRAIVADDLREGRHECAVLRFPPEPNGYLHIGHAKSIVLNFGIARETGGRCHLRFDDTNPETEDVKYVDSIIDSVRWLGYDWGEHLYFASDYFERMYGFAEHLIRESKAYVDSQTEEQIRENRGTVKEPGRPSPYRERNPEENLDLFHRMRAGEFANGEHVLRAKIDMASRNMLLRDPLIYRIRHADHYRSGGAWCVYPLYDFAHPTEDAIESITHSLCTLEFENNRPFYNWIVENLPRGEHPSIPPESRPRQIEFARLNLDFTVMSKRKLLELVRGGQVSGWDDPRMPTIAGMRRRGFTPESIRTFCEMVGVAKTNSRVDIGKLEFAIRDDLNQKAPRVLCVTRPLRVVLTNYPEGATERLDAPYYPHDVPLEGSRELPFSRELYIERDDFMEEPAKGFFRLSPGEEVRLRYGYIIRCDEVVKDGDGEVVELRCSYDPATRGGTTPDGRKVRGTIHWVSAEHGLPCEVRLYDRLFSIPEPDAAEEDFKNYLNPDSLVVENGFVEPSVAGDPAGSRYQFERLGYFCVDSEDSRPDALVFNRTVTLRDTWAKAAKAAAQPEPGRKQRKQPSGGGSEKKEPRGEPVSGTPAPPPPRSPELETRRARYENELGIGSDEADILTRETPTADLFEAALESGASAAGLANWVIHELPREIGGRTIENLPFGGPQLGDLVRLVEDGTLSSSAGREVLAEMVNTGDAPGDIVRRLGLEQVSGEEALAPLVDETLAANAVKADEYRAGKTGLLGFFVGQIMRKTGGKANPEVVNRLLRQRLEG